MPESIPLTPEAARVVAAFDAVMDRAGVFEGATDALAAALREVAAVINGYIPPHTPYEGDKGYKTGLLRGISCVRFIADNIEQAITYAENQSDGN